MTLLGLFFFMKETRALGVEEKVILYSPRLQRKAASLKYPIK